MKILSSLFFILVSTTSISHAQEPNALKDDSARLNYSVGYQIGSDFRQQEFEVRSDAILRGISDALGDRQALMSRQEMKQIMADMGKKVANLKQRKREMVSGYQENNRQFLMENSSKPGVITTSSGLQYRVVEQGKGNNPTRENEVLVHYRGRLINGTEFDSSIKRGKPASFRLDQVIKGWGEALQLMQRGSRWQLFIPSELGYGARGAGTSIPPNSTLIFDVELIAIR